MKNLILLIVSILTLSANAQNIVEVLPKDMAVIEFPDDSHVRVGVKATIDQKVFAVVFSVDPDGVQKILKGKNKNYWAGVTFWDQKNAQGQSVYELTSILDGIREGTHTLRVDVFSDKNTIVATQEITFAINYFL